MILVGIFFNCTLITDDFSDEFVDFENDHTVNEFDGI